MYIKEDGTDVKDGLTMDPSFKDMDRVFRAIDKQYHMKAIARDCSICSFRKQ